MAEPRNPKTCLYEVLGVERDASDEVLKKAYRKKALQWHPDKNRDQIEHATNVFKEIQEAYETLSDKQERAWYDSHREQILRGISTGQGQQEDMGINLWQYFSSSAYDGFGDKAGGFFSVYQQVFEKMDSLERTRNDPHREYTGAPEFGRSDASHEHVKYFYDHWSSFSTKRTFNWMDKWKLPEAPNRRIRRAMEAENKKERAKGKKEYTQLVNKLLYFVKKRDHRVAAYRDKIRQQKSEKQKQEKERKKKEAEERSKRRAQSKAGQDDRIAQSLAAKVEAYGKLSSSEESSDEEDPIECIPCRKVFRTENQWLNHQKSKKHKNTMAKYKAELLADEDLGDELSSSEESSVEEDPMECGPCGKVFRTENQYLNHQKSKKHKKTVAKLEAELLDDEDLEDESSQSDKIESETEGLESGLKLNANLEPSSDHQSENGLDTEVSSGLVAEIDLENGGGTDSETKIQSEIPENVEELNGFPALQVESDGEDPEILPKYFEQSESTSKTPPKQTKKKISKPDFGYYEEDLLSEEADLREEFHLNKPIVLNHHDSDQEELPNRYRGKKRKNKKNRRRKNFNDEQKSPQLPKSQTPEQTSEHASENSEPKKQESKKEKRRRKKKEKAQKQQAETPASKSNELICLYCEEEFNSKSKLFKHLKKNPVHAKPI